MSWPRYKTCPRCGANAPANKFKRVVLPAPLGPMMACRQPVLKRTSTPRTACTAPHPLVRPDVVKIALIAASVGGYAPSATTAAQAPINRPGPLTPPPPKKCPTTIANTKDSRRRDNHAHPQKQQPPPAPDLDFLSRPNAPASAPQRNAEGVDYPSRLVSYFVPAEHRPPRPTQHPKHKSGVDTAAVESPRLVPG